MQVWKSCCMSFLHFFLHFLSSDIQNLLSPYYPKLKNIHTCNYLQLCRPWYFLQSINKFWGIKVVKTWLNQQYLTYAKWRPLLYEVPYHWARARVNKSAELSSARINNVVLCLELFQSVLLSHLEKDSLILLPVTNIRNYDWVVKLCWA